MAARSLACPVPAATIGWRSRLARTTRDSWLILINGFRHLQARPGELAGLMIFPIMFTLLFGYVFGSAISIPGVDNYRAYMMPGLFAQGAAFAMLTAAIGMAELKQKGQMDRFRSLPMSRSAVLIGQSLYQTVTTLCGTLLTVVVALLVGWRIHTDAVRAAAGFGLLILFILAVNFVGVLIGMAASDPATADQSTMPVLMPLVFLSSAFVPAAGLPWVLKPVAEWNPVSATVAAMRELFGNEPTLGATNQAWPMAHPVPASLLWSLAIIAVALPLALRAYQRDR